MRNGYFEDYKPIFVMVGLEIIYAALSLLGKVALAQGMSAKVLVVYRQGLATLALAPVAYCSHRRNNSEVALGMKSFSLLFLAALLGTTLNQYFYFLGLHLGSAALATAMINLIPAITFIMAASLGLEKVSLRSSRSIAKIGGTILCVGGAMAMALLKGPKLLGMVLWISNAPHDVQGAGEDWVMGCVFLLGSCCCWSLWLILQVPISKCCSGPVSMAAWMCFLGFLQSAVLTFFLEPDSRAWRLGSSLQIFYCIYAGIVGTGVSVYVQAWCVSKRGPLFTAMFNPLCTVITTIFGFFLLHEELHLGSLAGAICVVVGLYIVLWGKAQGVHTQREQIMGEAQDVHSTAGTFGLEDPLLVDGGQDTIEGNKLNTSKARN
uniref:WAT1-related protein n=1 Tax=Anthurium amnicola TaxID=1678845 RepID=A0A1D1XKC3_9ARAE